MVGTLLRYIEVESSEPNESWWWWCSAHLWGTVGMSGAPLHLRRKALKLWSFLCLSQDDLCQNLRIATGSKCDYIGFPCVLAFWYFFVRLAFAWFNLEWELTPLFSATCISHHLTLCCGLFGLLGPFMWKTLPIDRTPGISPRRWSSQKSAISCHLSLWYPKSP